MKRAAQWALLWLVPLAFCYWLHQYGLRSWFWSDDFAWLGLHTLIFDRESFLRTLFEPFAQGTIRPLSERAFFLLFFKLFGFDAFPYHALALATEFANLGLLAWIMRRLGGSRFAAGLAPALWAANAALVVPVGWASDYNQVLWAFFLLSAFALYLSGHFWLQLIVFVLGFGALELNIIYPAILLAWLLISRKDWKPTLPLFGISAIYYLIHRHFAPDAAGGPYALHFDISICSTIYQYWKLSWIPDVWLTLPHHAVAFATAAEILLSIAALFFAFRAGRRGLFFLLWFVITLAPILPLRDHITDYYLAIPTLGLAALLALGQDSWTAAKLPSRLLALIPIGLYLFIQIPSTRLYSHWNYERSREVRTLVLGVIRARELHPGQTILLAHLTPYLYATSVAHSPFHAAGIEDVYLTPDTDFSTYPNLEPPSTFTLPAGPALYGLATDKIEVYEPAGDKIRNITASYAFSAPRKIPFTTPSRVDVGIPLMAYLLGSSWYPLEGSHRWMPGAATVRIAGPQTPNAKLVITGYCPQEQARLGPLKLYISIDGKRISEADFSQPELPFTRIVNLPASTVGKAAMEVLIEVSRTFPGLADGRPLGLAFGTFEVR